MLCCKDRLMRNWKLKNLHSFSGKLSFIRNEDLCSKRSKGDISELIFNDKVDEQQIDGEELPGLNGENCMI